MVSLTPTTIKTEGTTLLVFPACFNTFSLFGQRGSPLSSLFLSQAIYLHKE